MLHHFCGMYFRLFHQNWRYIAIWIRKCIRSIYSQTFIKNKKKDFYSRRCVRDMHNLFVSWSKSAVGFVSAWCCTNYANKTAEIWSTADSWAPGITCHGCTGIWTPSQTHRPWSTTLGRSGWQIQAHALYCMASGLCAWRHVIIMDAV